MATVEPGDTSLVNLYANKGNADPLIVACAVVENQLAEQFLVRPAWIVVSNDKAVRAKSIEVGVTSLSRGEFFATTDGAW